MTPEQRGAYLEVAKKQKAEGKDFVILGPDALISLIAQVEALTRKEKALQGLADLRYAEVLELTAQLSEALTVPQWISVETALPKCSKKPNSLGVEVIVYPQPESGESSAFFGCRVTDKPGFYKYGHMVKGVTHWMYIPTIPAIPGTKEGA